MTATFAPMDPRVKGLWLEALRSGKYKQGQRYLATQNDEYCCLGVLCDLAAAEGITSKAPYTWPESADDDGTNEPELWAYSGRTGFPTEEVNKWAGLRRLDPVSPNPLHTAAEMNDTRGATFAEIADWIEREL